MTRALSSQFGQIRVLVVGDLMLDQYYTGKVGRISPEAPVPIVQVQNIESRLGGAANVAANVAGLGAQCVLAGYVGRDPHGAFLRSTLTESAIACCLVDWERPTITKTRVIGARQQMLRLDFEDVGPATDSAEAELLHHLQTQIPLCQAVVFSDYAKGCGSSHLCQTLVELCRQAGIPILIDPKTPDWTRYHGATLVTPNFSEFQEIVGELFPNDDAQIEERTASVLEHYALGGILVTRGEKGMTLHARSESHLHIRARAREVFDISGAGDTVVATLAVGLGAHLSLADSVQLANHAAGIVVGKVGTAPIGWNELEESLRQQSGDRKICSTAFLEDICSNKRRGGQKLVFTNGCFDILHRGHLQLLRAARALGDVLIVGLNSDNSVRRLKGETRPINTQDDRALMLAGLEFVDFVCIFDEDTPAQLLSQLRPDILVKGGDYTVETVVGREFAGEVRLIPFVEGFSTSRLLERLRGDEA